MLPLTIGFISARVAAAPGSARVLPSAAAFAAGTASTLAGAGMAAAAAGTAYAGVGSGPLRDALPLAAGVVAVAAGLNLLGLLRARLPGLDADLALPEGTPPLLAAFAAGAGSALAASPCATPVLATLLAYAAAADTPPALGGALLLTYSAGYVAPLLAAAAGAGGAARVVALRGATAWVSPAAGVALVLGGTYAVASRLLA